MFFTVISIALFAIGLYFSRKKDWLYVPLFVLALLMVSYDAYMLFEGENIMNYYNGGSGIVYRDYRINETDNSTYSVDTSIYDMSDSRIGMWVAYQETEKAAMPFLSLSLYGVVAGIILWFLWKFGIAAELFGKTR